MNGRTARLINKYARVVGPKDERRYMKAQWARLPHPEKRKLRNRLKVELHLAKQVKQVEQ